MSPLKPEVFFKIHKLDALMTWYQTKNGGVSLLLSEWNRTFQQKRKEKKKKEKRINKLLLMLGIPK